MTTKASILPWNTTCRLCKSTKAYQGLNECECPTRWCDNFSEKQKSAVDEEEERQRIIEEDYLYHKTKDAVPTASAEEDYSEYYKTMSKLMSNPFLQGMPIMGGVPASQQNPGYGPVQQLPPPVTVDSGTDDSDMSKSSMTTKNSQLDDNNYDYYEYDDYHVDHSDDGFHD